MACFIAVHDNGLRRRSKIGAFAAYNDKTKMVMGEIAFDTKFAAPHGTICPAVFHFDFFGRRPCISQRLSGATVGSLAGAHLAEFTPPSHQFVAVEMRIPAIGQRGERTVLKADLGGVGALGGARGIPVSGEG